ncbi:MAG: exonuclease domain-containing protein [Lachnospiraceae bacterium]|nr:exonuclease domain-containing protein [Lachnospiraceae bacterium]
MKYIVLDLEWNQSNTGKEKEIEQLPAEIIEIGAIKVDEAGLIVGEFSQLVKPVVYREMHHFTSQLIHMQMEELERGKPFAKVAGDFLEWCGEEEYLFCTWGSTDLTELQRNMRFHNMEPLADGPMRYLDVQKLFSIAYEDRKTRRALEYAVNFLNLEEDLPYHRAFSDAYYTARIFERIMQENRESLSYESYDVFHVPKSRKEEVKVQFDTYAKYISREFADKRIAFADREVCSSKCYLCHRNLRKKIKWFTANGRHYYCLAYCEIHGYLKGKIRIRKTDEGGMYVVKTTKLITDEAAEDLMERKKRAQELNRKHKQKEKESRNSQ